MLNYFCSMMKNMFSTIAVFQYAAEAHILKGRLEANGIEVFMTDHYTINTDPLVSNAIGGVKLKVKTGDVEKANTILSEISKYSLSDEQKSIYCPECNSSKIQMMTVISDFKSLVSFLVGLLFLVLPFYTRYKYKCLQCKKEFNIK